MGEPARKNEVGTPPVERKSNVLRLVAQREQSLLALMELSHELSVSLDFYGIADLALFNLMGQLGSSRAAIWIIPPDINRPPVLLRSHGIRRHLARAMVTAFGPRLAQSMKKSEEPKTLAQLEEVLGAKGQRLSEEAGVTVWAPIFARGNLFALFALGHRVDLQDFKDVDLQILQASLGMVGVALENTGLYNRLLEKHRQLQTANENLKELAHLKSEFLRNVNHELRTPLTIIIAYLNFLMEEEDEDGQRREFLQTITNESLRLKSLLEKLLDFSAISGDNLEIHAEMGNISTLLKTFHHNRAPGVAESLHEFTFDRKGDIPPVNFDPLRTRQILDILVDNAVKFTPQGSKISLVLHRDPLDPDAWVRVDVTDDGPGIPEERLPHLFDAFRQGDGSVTRSVGGMGMGLAFAKKVTEKMGGRLEVTSEIGKGSSFTVYLPTAGPSEELTP